MADKAKRGKAISKVKRVKVPTRLLFFDTEGVIDRVSDRLEKHKLRMIVTRYMLLDDDNPHIVKRDEYRKFTTAGDFADYVVTLAVKNVPLNVYAHNLGYDLQITSLVRALINRGFSVTKYITENPPTFITMRRGKHTINIIDTFNYFQTSIKRIGESLGLMKGVIDYYGETDDEKWEEYAFRDVEILSEYMYRFILFLIDYDLAPLAMTIAGQAFRTYRYRFMPDEIPLHRSDEAIAVERDAYYGGRVECFRLGTFNGETYYKLDINSMYPFVMARNAYPFVYVGKRDNVSRLKLIELMKDYYVIADLDIKTDLPVAPVRVKDKLIFPIGRFRATLHHAEIDLVLRYATVERVNRVFVYTKRDLFSSYVDFFYRIKQEADSAGDSVRRAMAKMFLNSLYGKFGQRGRVDIYEEAQGSDDGYERIRGYSERLGREVMITRLGGKTITSITDGEGYYSYPAVAGAVTAYARDYLFELILSAGLDNVYYVDTDSLFVNSEGLYNLRDYISSSELGKLKIEDKADNLIIYGAKDYVFGTTLKMKGVPKTAIKVDDNTYRYPSFRGLKGWEKAGMPDEVEVKYTDKRLRRVYDKGRVEGTRVYPWVLPGDDGGGVGGIGNGV